MQAEKITRKRRRYAPRRTTGDRVREALLSIASGEAEVLTHEETSWASITFSGTRHAVTLGFNGETAISAGETLIAVLPDHEFTIPGQLVAEAVVDCVNHRLAPSPRLVVTIALLLLEEA